MDYIIPDSCRDICQIMPTKSDHGIRGSDFGDDELSKYSEIISDLKTSHLLYMFTETKTRQTTGTCLTICTIADMINFTEIPDVAEVNIVVTGPTGIKYPVNPDNHSFPRFTVTFVPDEAGQYTITCFWKNMFHVQGSPCIIFVETDYSKMNEPIATINILNNNFVVPNPHKMAYSYAPREFCWNDTTGQIIVVDQCMNRVVVFKLTGDIDFIFGEYGKSDGFFDQPRSIAFDRLENRIFVSDKMNHRIQIFSSKGTFISKFGGMGSGPGRFLYPHGIKISPDGSVIAVADTHNYRIQLFDANGIFLRILPHWEHSSPTSIAFNPTGEWLYVVTYKQQILTRIDVLGISRSVIPRAAIPYLLHPSGIAVDTVGNLIITDLWNKYIVVLKPDGTFVRRIFDTWTPKGHRPAFVAQVGSRNLAILNTSGVINIF